MSDAAPTNSTLAERRAARLGAKQVKPAQVLDKGLVPADEEDPNVSEQRRPPHKRAATK